MGHNNGHTLLYVVIGSQLCTISACGIFTGSSYTKYQDCTTICSSVMAHFMTELCQAWPGDLDFWFMTFYVLKNTDLSTFVNISAKFKSHKHRIILSMGYLEPELHTVFWRWAVTSNFTVALLPILTSLQLSVFHLSECKGQTNEGNAMRDVWSSTETWHNKLSYCAQLSF